MDLQHEPDDEDTENDDLPSSYCGIMLNHPTTHKPE
jgi:hypothetical protein